ncbi:MAG: hypothetical protein HY700_03985 [Gemmatimonadetes bacterium]|nr:hypothetical protein [Gemmatimonadota bacterium]
MRLNRARRTVDRALGVRILLIAGAGYGAVVLAAALLDAVLELPSWWRRILAAMAGVGAATTALRLILLAWRSRSDESLALWIEAHHPLDYLLVTAADPRCAGNPELEKALAAREFEPAVSRAAWRGVRRPAIAAALIGVATMVLLPAPRLARVVRPRAGDVLNLPARTFSSRTRPLVVRYTAPAYAGGEAVTFEDPTSIRGLEGGSLEVRGPGNPDGLVVAMGDTLFQASKDESRWQVRLGMPPSPAVLRIRDGPVERLLGLEPVRDTIPAVRLVAPDRDSVVRVASGRIRLAALASDDRGLARGWFELIVSSGTGELFRFRTSAIGRRSLGGRSDSLSAILRLDSLQLQPGDILHLRAVATDLGPGYRGLGSSETRTIRVSRPGEADTAAVVLMPPLPGDTAALSERLLIQLAEALEARRSRLARPVLVRESQDIGRDQANLRKQVADIVFTRLSTDVEGEHAHRAQADTASDLTPGELLRQAEEATAPDSEEQLDFQREETPVVAINRPLLEAYNAMWDASRELDIGEPGRALPHMRAALEAIQRARAAERVYLRGRAVPAVVDVNRVRLSGKREDLRPVARAPGPAGLWEQRLRRFVAAISLIPADVPAARDSLLVLRLELLPDAPAVAASLGEAIAALRGGRNPLPPLASARAALAGEPSLRRGLGGWERAGW